MKISLKDRVILVTGASRGIGKAITESLASASGTIAIHYHRQADAAQQLASSAGHGSHSFQADLSTAEAADQLVDQVLQYYGRVDVLVNNAGISPSIESLEPFSEWQANWLRTLQVNVISAARLSERLIPHFRQRGEGRIIHIASRAAFRGDTPFYMAYAASKGAMVAYSRSIARHYGKEGITSFVVAPGFTRTDMAQVFIDQYGEKHATHDLALSTLTEPSDVSPTVLFLASGLMDHATGCTIDINAGSYVR